MSDQANAPDPHVDFIGAISFVAQQVSEISSRLAEFEEAYSTRKFYLEDIGDLLGCSLSVLAKKPWNLPRYGRPDQTGAHGRRFWWARSVRAWYSRSEDERRAEWDMMSAKERRAALGVSA